MQQKDIFLHGEGDAWYQRNRAAISDGRVQSDRIVATVAEILASPLHAAGTQTSLLEVGCSNGLRLERLSTEYGLNVHGIEPSRAAVDDAQSRGLAVKVGTADRLEYPDASFDLVVFGFCLYLCDPEDLFAIAAEADRVLKPSGWIVIHDFFGTSPSQRLHHHRPGILSRKMDYRTLFSWHPSYVCFSHHVGEHGKHEFADNRDDWTATSVMRKHAPHQT